MAISRSDRVRRGGAVKRRRMSSAVPIRANSKSFETSVGMTPDGPALFVSVGGATRAVALNLDEVETKATGGISVKKLKVDNEQLTTTMGDVSAFAGSGTFNASGTYAGLRAGATTASDVDLGSVINAAQLQKANNLSDLDTVATARTNLGIGTSDSVSIQSLTASDTLSVAQKLLFASTEELGTSGAASHDKIISYFTTAGTETASLSAGTNGQLKVFYMVSNGGSGSNTMTITVTNSAWGGSNYLIFNGDGECAILMYFNSKWNIVSNVGSVATS